MNILFQLKVKRRLLFERNRSSLDYNKKDWRRKCDFPELGKNYRVFHSVVSHPLQRFVQVGTKEKYFRLKLLVLHFQM